MRDYVSALRAIGDRLGSVIVDLAAVVPDRHDPDAKTISLIDAAPSNLGELAMWLAGLDDASRARVAPGAIADVAFGAIRALGSQAADEFPVADLVRCVAVCCGRQKDYGITPAGAPIAVSTSEAPSAIEIPRGRPKRGRLPMPSRAGEVRAALEARCDELGWDHRVLLRQMRGPSCTQEDKRRRRELMRWARERGFGLKDIGEAIGMNYQSAYHIVNQGDEA